MNSFPGAVRIIKQAAGRGGEAAKASGSNPNKGRRVRFRPSKKRAVPQSPRPVEKEKLMDPTSRVGETEEKNLDRHPQTGHLE